VSKQSSPAASRPDSIPGSSAGGPRQLLSGRADVVLLHAALYRLRSSPDPKVVFTGAADLMIPLLCDEASVEVYLGDRLARWQDNPPATDGIPAPRASGGRDGHPAAISVTVHTSSLPAEPDGWTGGLDYVAALTCRWYSGEEPTASAVALIKIVARYAAAMVHQGQQAELIQAQDLRIQRLERDRQA
jgi:hypothetical protein